MFFQIKSFSLESRYLLFRIWLWRNVWCIVWAIFQWKHVLPVNTMIIWKAVKAQPFKKSLLCLCNGGDLLVHNTECRDYCPSGIKIHLNPTHTKTPIIENSKVCEVITEWCTNSFRRGGVDRKRFSVYGFHIQWRAVNDCNCTADTMEHLS